MGKRVQRSRQAFIDIYLFVGLPIDNLLSYIAY